MEIKRIITNELEENCYIISDNGNCVIIDPGGNFDSICRNVSGNVVGLLITHHHFDHIGALDDVKRKFNINENDFNIDGFKIEVIKTPGHSNDSLTFYFKDYDLMFTGDFIFNGAIGRCDLPTGSIETMKQSLKMMKKYPENITIFPGHGESSVLGVELKKLGI